MPGVEGPWTASWIEVLWLLIEAIGVWYVVLIWRGAARQAHVADAYRRSVTHPADVLEAEAMVAIAADRQARNAALVAILLAGAILGVWALLIPPPIRTELQAFSLGASVVFLLRDGLLVWAARQSYHAGEHANTLLWRRRALLENGNHEATEGP